MGGRSPAPAPFALLGAGDVAERHAPGWQRAARGELALVVDADAERARAFAARWEVPRWGTDIDAAAEDDVVGADVCLPPGLHAAAVRAFAGRGKHVLVEKPLTPTVREALELQRLVDEAGVVAMVAENWPFSTALERVDGLLAEGALGEPFMVRAAHDSDMFVDLERHAAAHPWGLDPVEGGFMLRAGVHSIAIAREFLGEYEELFACTTERRALDRQAPDTDTVVAARFRDGGVGSFGFTGRSRHVGPRRMRMTLFATDGHVWFDVLTGEVVVAFEGREERTLRRADASLGYAEEVEHFVDCVVDGAAPRTGLGQQVAALAATFAAYRSIEERRPVAPAEMVEEARPQGG